jgi:hypothetical protein
MSTRLLADSIALMETRQGKTAIGASGLITNLVDIVSKLPTELKDGLFSTGTFSQTNTIDPTMSDKEFEKFKKRSDKVIAGLEDGLEEFLKTNPSASDVLGKLRVNARMLTYSLANSLKEKDRLTNRDLQLLEELTEFRLIKNPARIQEKYEELLRRVKQKNAVRRTRFGTLGNSDIAIQNIIGQIYKATKAEARPEEKTVKPKTTEDAFDILIQKAIPN